jgi:site-specific DNA-methyltransferase (adenine-specific)
VGSIVFNSDCVEGMKQFPDKYFDLAIVDPPYGIGENGSTNKTRGKLAKSKNYKSFAGGDVSSPNKEYFVELKRVSKNVIIWGANHFIENIPNQNSSCWIVWDKVNGKTDFADCELAWTSFKSSVRQFTFRWQGMLQKNMKDKEARIHPTQKPVALYDWIYKNYAEEGMKVLDTHLGSGSNRISAHKYKMDFTAFEIDKEYFDKAEQRYRDFISQTTLF